MNFWTTFPAELGTPGWIRLQWSAEGIRQLHFLPTGPMGEGDPLPILVPCHRVLASNGPGGFSLFGSLQAKVRLLALEGVSLPC
ncbi:MGMT family protein [Holophaga foetida]|uniref:MGMT family protein n=1 Tax=Holophaga foetida TaxID=35839 RepID=UPI001B7FE061|nr:MGMT family protein [Holophaga foetida]